MSTHSTLCGGESVGGGQHYQTSPSSPPAVFQPFVKFANDLDVIPVSDTFRKRGWTEVRPEDDWNIYWANVPNARNIFNVETRYRLARDQIINHYPNHYELTRKDLMMKNLKRYRRELDKQRDPLAERDVDGNFVHLEFWPTSYVLPNDYNLFTEDFRKMPNSKWIMKPPGKAQGTGIFLINKLSQLKKWNIRNTQGQKKQPQEEVENYVICRYIENPLLIGGKKFDLRLFVLVTSFKPLISFIHKQGFCRFCTVKYTTNNADIGNKFIHLTNVAIQKLGDEYNNKHGGKWPIENFKLYLESTRGRPATAKLFADIRTMLVVSLRAVAETIISDSHCFELYGYDIIVDVDLKPWLIEVNASPSLNTTTERDRSVKLKLMEDCIRIVYEMKMQGQQQNSSNTALLGVIEDPRRVTLGDFELLACEEKTYKTYSDDDSTSFGAKCCLSASASMAAAAAIASVSVSGSNSAANKARLNEKKMSTTVAFSTSIDKSSCKFNPNNTSSYNNTASGNNISVKLNKR